jgi:hypothetical protein
METNTSNTAAPSVEVPRLVMPVYWKQSTSNQICWSKAVAVEERSDGRKIVRFDDGGWNPAEACFFTEEQCRKYHKLPPPQFTERQNEIAAKLETLARSLRAYR